MYSLIRIQQKQADITDTPVLTHCGLVTSYGDIDLSPHFLR